MTRTLHRIDLTGLPYGLEHLHRAMRAHPRLGEWEEITTGAEPLDVRLDIYETRITTGGTQGAELLRLNLFSPIVHVEGARLPMTGQRNLIRLAALTHPADVVSLDAENIETAAGVPTTAVELDAEGEFLLLQYTGLKWQVVYANATITEEA